MNFDGWISGYKVRAFPWINGKHVYFNVQYFAPGQSIERPPVWDKSVLITDDAAGRRLMNNFTHTLVEHIARMQIPANAEVIITVGEGATA